MQRLRWRVHEAVDHRRVATLCYAMHAQVPAGHHTITASGAPMGHHPWSCETAHSLCQSCNQALSCQAAAVRRSREKQQTTRTKAVALLARVAAMLQQRTTGQARGNRDGTAPCQDAHGRAGAKRGGARTQAGIPQLDRGGRPLAVVFRCSILAKLSLSRVASACVL